MEETGEQGNQQSLTGLSGRAEARLENHGD
jgi:hypothetical protein